MTPLTASAVFSVRVCAKYFGCHYKYCTHRVQGMFCFCLSLIIFTLFFHPPHPPAERLWESMFWLSVRKITRQGFLENTFSLCPNTDAMSAGEQQHCWTTWRLSLLTFCKKKNVTGVICNPLTHCSRLYWAIASTWGELNGFSSHLPGVNKLPENVTYDPNFPDAYDRCLSLQVRVNCVEVYFSILTNL